METTDNSSIKDRIGRALEHRGLTVGVAIVVLAIAVLALHHLVADVPWAEVKNDIAAVPVRHIALAGLFTAVGYCALACYDVLAVKTVAPGRVPLYAAAAAGAGGYSVSNLLGFSWVTGGAVRFRIYSAYGLDWTLVAAIIATSWVSLWLGIMLLLGGVLVLHPEGLATGIGLSATLDMGAGIAILIAIGAFFVWLSGGKRSIGAGAYRVGLPRSKIAMAQTATGVIDILGASLTLYILMPGDLTQNFALFFLVYVSAVGLGILSHAPGGVGVFEATVMAGLGASGRPDVIAALALYRLIYYVAPFSLTVFAVAGLYAASHRNKLGGWGKTIHRTLSPAVPIVAAGVALIAGALLLASGSLPADSDRMAEVRSFLPLPLVEASHLIGSIVGVLLLVVANGLFNKRRRAWVAACVLVGIGFVTSLSKGLDWEEAALLIAAFTALVLFRPAFYKTGGGSLFRPDWRWLLACFALLAVTIWIGVFAFSHVPYSTDLWWRVAWGDDAPRYLRASLAAAVLLGAVALNVVLTTQAALLPADDIPDRVRELVASAPSAEANISLTGDKRFLISEDGRAFIAYADSGRSLIAKGDPVGAHDAGEAVIWRLREMADRLGKRCVFYAVSQAYLPTYLDVGMSLLKIGEVARVNLTDFSFDGSSKKELRHVRSRAERDGFQFEVIKAADIDTALAELRGISDAWLLSKQGTEKQFALGAFRDDYMRNFDCAVLRHAETRQIVAFANLFQGADKHELSIDLMRYAPDGPKFAMDALFACLLHWGKIQGYQWFSLGAAPLAGMQSHPLATKWNRIGAYVYRHGNHFYHFEGLRGFKEKFHPVWSPHYMATQRGLKAPLALLEVNALISGGLRGLIK